MKLKRVKTQRPLFLREEKELNRKEYFRLIGAAQKSGKIQLALCMETIAATGVRVSELPYFTVENIKKGRIEIFNKGKYRRILLGGDIRKKLLQYCKKNGIGQGSVFITRSGRPKNRSNLWREMKALKKQAGVSERKNFPPQLPPSFCKSLLPGDKRHCRVGRSSGTQQLKCYTYLHLGNWPDIPETAGQIKGSPNIKNTT